MPFSIADYYYNLQTNGTSSPYKFYPPSNSGPLGSRYFICRSIHNRVRHAFLRSHCSTTHQGLSTTSTIPPVEHTPDYLRIRRGGIYKLIMDNTSADNNTSSSTDVQSAENFINNLVEGTNNNQPAPPPSDISPMDVDTTNNNPPPPPPPVQEEQTPANEPPLDTLAGEASQKMPSNNNTNAANNNNNDSDAIFNPPPPEQIIQAAAAAGGNPNPQNNNGADITNRKTEGGKAPRSENKWLRNSPTSIGDGYTSILNSLSTIHSTFNNITSNTMQGSILGGNSPEYQTILIRLNTIKNNCNMLCTNQLQNRLVNDYNLPLLISEEINYCEDKLVQLSTSSSSDDDGSSEGMNNELKKIQETLSKIKPFSIELSNQLSTSIQSNKEKYLEDGDMNLRQPKLKSTLVTNGGGVGGGDGSSMGRGERGISGRSKTLPMISKLHQPKPQQRLQDSNTNPFESHSLEMFDKLQFLQPQEPTKTNEDDDGSTEMNMKNGTSRDYSKRITFQGDVIDRIAAVPTSANEIMPTNGNNNNNNASMISSEAMNGIYPTMAPPMLPHKSTYSAAYGGNELDYALENKLQNNKKKGKKKRKKKHGRDSMDSTSGPKKKRGRGRPRLYESDSDDDDILKPSSNNVRKSNGYVRTIPEFTITQQTHTITTDANPNRVCNPLLRLPQFPDGKDPSIIDIPQAGELWKLSDLHYYDGDTYPVSYLARILGFDVKEDATNEEFGKEFDVGKIGKMNNDNGDGDDYASLVPARGTFCDRVWKKQDGKASGSSTSVSARATTSEGLTDDLNLTYSDPLWANILSSYKGYNEDDFKDAGKGFADDLSQLCLDYARERGVILKKKKTDKSDQEKVDEMSKESGDQKKSANKEEVYKNDRMRFRFATEKDEEMLSSMTEKCQWKSNPKHDLATCLKSQSHFCIVAELAPNSSSDSTPETSKNSPIAYLQYRFCWYGVEDKKMGVSTDKVSELVIFIDNLVCNNVTSGDDNSVSSKDIETANVLLSSLALVHAVREGIWYGMTESPEALVPFFTKYLRMDQINKVDDDSKDYTPTTVPLVLDIKKCHYKYAILLLEESLNEQPSRPDQKYDAASSGERMIVTLNGNSVNAQMERLSSLQQVEVYSNPTDGARAKKAHVRMVREPDKKTELFSVTASTTDEETKEIINPINTSSIIAAGDWNIVRSFPVSETAAIEKKEESLDSSTGPNDLFLADMKKKQATLLALESSIETTSREILSKAYAEHSEFVTGSQRDKRELDKQKIEEYQAVQKRLQEAELAWQAQLDQDMDAVCDVCFDGEVTPENQIIFCDACNVAVHQRCYGIDQIPTGNYFCQTCIHFEVDKEYLAARRRAGPPTKITRHPIICELCPRRQGAFVQVDQPVKEGEREPKKAKWVHVGCAKWQGMNYIDDTTKDKIEDLTVLKNYFKAQGYECCLCKGKMGALHPCREEGCDKFMHLTCARSVGKCSVQHGENCDGFYDPNELEHAPWTLACPKHSVVDPESVNDKVVISEYKLQKIAETYPPEPVPPKPFYKMSGTERLEYWSDQENLKEFFEKMTTSLIGAKCPVCELPADPNIDKRCDKCGMFSHADCADPTRGDGATCLTCRFKEEHANDPSFEEPKCHMCVHGNESVGPLVKCFAKPMTMKKWKTNMGQFQRSTFGKNKFVHALCGMWNPLCKSEQDEEGNVHINCSGTAMSDGIRHVSHQFRCTLCGLSKGAKVDCAEDKCIAPGGRRNKCKFHVTCARQAGLEVQVTDAYRGQNEFLVKCFNHVDCTFVFRARLEDMKELELDRNGKKFKSALPMSWSHASQLFNSAINIMRTLGWAWRWAEWWVEDGDNWEPLLEEGEVEAEMTDEQLKRVKSDKFSRCDDARKCRLAAFGAALRNRDYDIQDGDDQEPLERALTAVLSIKSLCGPLKKKEIEFYVTWLGLAYRSKSPLLGFGKDKVQVAEDLFCVHQFDSSPKYILGTRPLPGKVAPQKGVFEPTVVETDDFMRDAISLSPPKKKRRNLSEGAPDGDGNGE